jgi:hypothetical protein
MELSRLGLLDEVAMFVLITGQLWRDPIARQSKSGRLNLRDAATSGMLIIESPEAAVAFKHVFDTLFDSGEGQAKRKAK